MGRSPRVHRNRAFPAEKTSQQMLEALRRSRRDYLIGDDTFHGGFLPPQAWG